MYYGHGKLDEPKMTNINAFKKWHAMLRRCYCESYLAEKPSYKECTVCEEWHSFSNFRKWFESQNHSTDRHELDKDALLKGNKHYSPETCEMIPRAINTAMTTYSRDSVENPSNVYKIKNKYVVRIHQNGKKRNFGTYATQQEELEYVIR